MCNTKGTLSYYNTNTSSFVESTQSVKMTEAWNRFTSKLEPSSLILDFGCGSGRDTKYFLEQGFKVEAMDGSEELCKAASEYTGIIVKHQLFQDWKSEPKYNGVWACSSILHLNKIEEWITSDVRPGREEEKWLNVILKKI